VTQIKATPNNPAPRASDLEFPDWSGQLPRRSRMTFAEAVRWNEEVRRLFFPNDQKRRRARQSPCPVEFVL
jgi:hypothetical protein